MGGLRPLGDGVGEIKRIYVRRAFSGMRVGQSILQPLLADTRAFGYPYVCPDSPPFIQSVQRF